MLPVAIDAKAQDDDDDQDTRNEVVDEIPNKCCQPEIMQSDSAHELTVLRSRLSFFDQEDQESGEQEVQS